MTNKLNNKSVLITGGLGFVGSALAKELVEKFNCIVTIVDNELNSNRGSIKAIEEKITYIKADVSDINAIASFLGNQHYIFHLACIQIAASSKNPVMDLKVNAESTLNLLEFFRHSRSNKLERFIYSSSGSVYGSSVKLPLLETEFTGVLSIYAATKLLGEHYTLIYGRNYGIPVSSVRYSNIYGFGQTPNNAYCGVMGKFIHNALMGKPLTIIGDGEQTRDYTFISDAIDATVLCATHPMALNEVFNVSTNVETSVNELAELITEMLPEIQIEYIPERDIDNIRRRSLSVDKIQQKLGFNPQINIKKGVKLTLEWYKSYLNSISE